MRTELRCKVMSVFLAAVMVLGLIPGDFAYAAEAAKETDSTVITFNASELTEGDITGETVVGDFVLMASGDKKYTVDANSKSNEDGSMGFTKRLKSNGKSTETERIIKFATGGAGTAKVYMLSSSSDDAERELALYNADTNTPVEDAAFYAPAKAGEDGKIEPVEYVIPEAGTYKLVASNGVNIYYIEVEYSGEQVSAVKRADWDSVALPVINSITLNEEGTLDVDVTVDISPDGADNARIILFQNGYENECELITESGVYTFTPNINGDFVFKVYASRKGCIDKESEEVTYKGYKVPLAIPAINWINNMGDGEVYIDWSNVGADKYELSYREDGTNKFTVVDSNITDGHYTITGLNEGSVYEFKVVATQEKVVKEDTMTFVVGKPKQQWYIAAIGSATSGVITVNDKEYEIHSDDEIVYVDDVTSGNGKITIAPQTNGKIADSEDGIFYYFTRVNPNTENFTLTATFTVTDVTLGPDNQTGYGIYATDIAGVGSKDAKYFNSVSVGQFKMKNVGYHAHGARLITGYTSHDAYNNGGDLRNHNNINAFSVKNEDDSVNVGDTFTYTLKKTNASYIASMEGASGKITFDGTETIMVQEDGSICVGVASTRKVGVEISDIEFETTKGEAGGVNVILTEPQFNIYSSETASSEDYEFIASANCFGNLILKDDAGKVIYNKDIEADKAVRIPTEIKKGDNTFTYEFTPGVNVENLKSYLAITGKHTVNMNQYGKPGDILYVSPKGRADNDGAASRPLDIYTAVKYAQPGQTIIMLNGTYPVEEEIIIGRSISGTEKEPITLVAETAGSVKINGSKLAAADSVLSVVGSYWHIYGLDVSNSKAKGITVSGNYNTIEMCTLHSLGSAGLQISRFSNEPNDDLLWPANNFVKNCDAHNCCDDGRTDADGFAAKLTCGEGNKFYGCISHHNIDDGWDLYAKSTTGRIGDVIIENCVSYSNGFLEGDDPTDTSLLFGEGNGFKLGGENMIGGHQLINCVSFNNYGKGITSNSGPNCEVINCTAYNNSLNGKSYNVSLYTKKANVKAWILNGMLSYVDNTTTSAELGSSNGVIYSLRSANNYLYDGADSFNTEGTVVTADWFESTDIKKIPTRNADGTINMNGLLVLTANAPSDTGARIDTGSNAVSVSPIAGTTTQTTGNTEATQASTEPVQEGSSFPVVPIAIVVVIAVVGFIVIKKIRG